MADRLNRPLLGIICVLAGMLAISVQDAIIKWISGDYPIHQIVFTRSCVAICLTVVFVRLEGPWRHLRTAHWRLHLARGLLLNIANISYFLALAAMPFADAIAIFFIAPLLITALSGPLLGERIGPWRWFAVAVGLAGVLLIIKPGVGSFRLASLMPVIAASAYAMMQILTRRLGATDKASVMAFYVQICFIIVGGAMGLALGHGDFAGSGDPSLEFLFRAWRWPNMFDAGLMLSSGILAGFVGYLLSQAYRVAEVNVIAPYEYVALPMAVIWGLLLWNHWPDHYTMAGIAIIIGAGLFVFYREARRRRA